jgi:hypothetical protein
MVNWEAIAFIYFDKITKSSQEIITGYQAETPFGLMYVRVTELSPTTYEWYRKNPSSGVPAQSFFLVPPKDDSSFRDFSYEFRNFDFETLEKDLEEERANLEKRYEKFLAKIVGVFT